MKISLSLLAVCVPLAAFSAGCSGAADQSDTSQSDIVVSRLDGQTIFRGIFFGTGPVAEKLPGIWKNPRLEALREQNQSAAAMSAKLRELAATPGLSHAAVGKLDTAAQAIVRRTKPINGIGSQALTTQQAMQRMEMIVHAIDVKDPSFFNRFRADMTSGNHVRVQASFNAARLAILEATLGAQAPVTLPGSVNGGWFYTDTDVAVDGYAVAVVAAVVFVVAVIEQPGGLGGDLESQLMVNMLTTELGGAE